MLLNDLHPFLHSLLLVSDAFETELNVFAQQAPIGILRRLGGVVAKVAEAQRQPIAAA
ncbi:hypothetical protein D3C76_1848900 [compost metagenome]